MFLSPLWGCKTDSGTLSQAHCSAPVTVGITQHRAPSLFTSLTDLICSILWHHAIPRGFSPQPFPSSGRVCEVSSLTPSHGLSLPLALSISITVLLLLSPKETSNPGFFFLFLFLHSHSHQPSHLNFLCGLPRPTNVPLQASLHSASRVICKNLNGFAPSMASC